MSSRHLVDPELAAFLEAFPTMNISAENIGLIRTARSAMLDQLPAFSDAVSVEERHIPGPKGAPPVRTKIYRCKNAAARRPAILHLHGGG